MIKIANEIKNATKGKHGHAVLYAGMIGLILSDIVPTPADALYFMREKKLRDQWKKGQITPEKYWAKTATAYYLYNPLWWILVLGVTVAFDAELNKKMQLALSLIGAGAVTGIVFKSMKKDIGEIREEISSQTYQQQQMYANASGEELEQLKKRPVERLVHNRRVVFKNGVANLQFKKVSQWHSM